MELWQLMNTYGQQNPNPQNTTTPSSYSQANPQQYAYPSYPSYPTSNYPNQPAYNYADYYSSQQMQYPSQTPAYSYYDPFQYPNQPYYQQMPPQPQYNNRNRYPPNRNNKPKSESKPVQTFRCEDCDKTYNNEEFYQRHMAGHTRCPVEGCQFIGSSSALSVHQLRQHNPRYRDAFKLLESPEGLQKYLEERKKNFPTKDAVNKKQEDLQRKIQRGEVVLQTKRFRDKRGRWQTEKKYCVNKNYKPAENAENTVAMATPTVPLEEGELPEEASSKVDPNQELVVIEEQEKDKKERKKKLCKHFKKGHCDRGDSCMFLHDESLINVKRKREDQSQQMSKKPTLLEKLLSKDILEEKSVVLQCLRFIVQNNFFENPVATSV